MTFSYFISVALVLTVTILLAAWLGQLWTDLAYIVMDWLLEDQSDESDDYTDDVGQMIEDDKSEVEPENDVTILLF
jgi:hypothetical protein